MRTPEKEILVQIHSRLKRPAKSTAVPAHGTPRPRTGSIFGVSAIARCTECGQRGGGATSPHHAARMPRRGVCAALRGGGDPRRFVRHCVAVSTLEGDLVLDPGRLHHARSP